MNRDYDKILSQGREYQESGDLDKAVECYEQLIENKPNEPKAYVNLGILYSSEEEYDSAMQCFNNAIDVSPQWANAFLNRGNLLMIRGDFNAAIADFDSAVKFSVDNPQKAYYGRGCCFMQMKKYREAIDSLSSCINIDPSDAESVYLRGCCFHAVGRQEDALTAYKASAQLGFQQAKDVLSLHGMKW